MNRIQQINFVFPNLSSAEREWNHVFGTLLMNMPTVNQDDLVFFPMPSKALPTTAFRAGNVSFPMIVMDRPIDMNIEIGRLLLADQQTSCLEFDHMISEQINEVNCLTSPNSLEVLSMTELSVHLKDRLISIDHTGLNIPTSILNKMEWNQLVQQLSEVTNLYNYPGEEWPFIIPSVENEYCSDIDNFITGRIPKFELVYDSYTELPILQFALNTDLSRGEAERIFPQPYGFGIPGLEEIFRSLFVQSPWSHSLIIRIDLYYKRNESIPTDWETGQWLVRMGGRVKRAETKTP
jgi:hypothetical protein